MKLSEKILLAVLLFTCFISLMHTINVFITCNGIVVKGLYKMECINEAE
jgi:hypothetical protein